nr:hypothetical protein [Tanacetum cinerariifolium]
ILFGTIHTTIPDTTPVIAPPTIEIPIIAPTIPPSPDYTPSSPDYSPASETESDPTEDPSSGHIPPLLAISSFLSSGDDTTDSDTPDTTPSPTHDTPFNEITASTQRSPVIPRRRVTILAPGQPIPHDSSSRHSSSDHSFLDLPSTLAGTSRKRRRSPMTSVPTLPLISRALSHVCDDFIPSPKRVRDIGYLADVEAIPVHRIQAIEGVQREQGHMIVGVESALTALTEMVAELERDNKRLRGTASVESQRFDRLQRDMSQMKAREAAGNLETLNENEEEQEGENGGNENRGNEGNGNGENGGNGGNGNGWNGENGNHG